MPAVETLHGKVEFQRNVSGYPIIAIMQGLCVCTQNELTLLRHVDTETPVELYVMLEMAESKACDTMYLEAVKVPLILGQRTMKPTSQGTADSIFSNTAPPHVLHFIVSHAIIT